MTGGGKSSKLPEVLERGAKLALGLPWPKVMAVMLRLSSGIFISRKDGLKRTSRPKRAEVEIEQTHRLEFGGGQVLDVDKYLEGTLSLSDSTTLHKRKVGKYCL